MDDLNGEAGEGGHPEDLRPTPRRALVQPKCEREHCSHEGGSRDTAKENVHLTKP
jgi:hypothetical protein